MENLDLISILGSTIRLSIPLIFTALAGLFTERAGVFDIGLEGKMLFSAFAAAVAAFMTGSPWMGLLAGIEVGWRHCLRRGRFDEQQIDRTIAVPIGERDKRVRRPVDWPSGFCRDDACRQTIGCPAPRAGGFRQVVLPCAAC